MYSGYPSLYPIRPPVYGRPGEQQHAGKRIFRSVIPAGKNAVLPGDAADDDGDTAHHNNAGQDPW